jgi:uroporphyrinogen decarboxylase
MSPQNYRDYVIPWLRRICNVAHKGGLKVILHSCGDGYKILDDLINAGVDAMHPIEPTTANPEYDIFKLKEKYSDKLCFIGNVSPQDLSDKDPMLIRSYTKKLIKKIAPGGGFILSSGHSINPAVKLENFLAMREILEKYGGYPIVLE